MLYNIQYTLKNATVFFPFWWYKLISIGMSSTYIITSDFVNFSIISLGRKCSFLKALTIYGKRKLERQEIITNCRLAQIAP